MSEDMARALGAASPLTVTIGGKECHVRPLGMKELTELQREALEYYRRQYLQTYALGLSLMPGDDGKKLFQDKLEEAARWDVDSLPRKTVYDPSRVKPTDELKVKLREVLEPETEPSDDMWRRMAASVLNQEMLSEADYQQLTGEKAPAVRIAYDSWWVTGCYEGMITFAWKCFQHNGVTKDQVAEALTGMGKLAEVTREIERLSAPSPNG